MKTRDEIQEPSFDDDFGGWLEAHGVEIGSTCSDNKYHCCVDLNTLKAGIASLIDSHTAEVERAARIDEVQHMPHERRPEQHEFTDGKFNGNCDCYKGRRLRKLAQLSPKPIEREQHE